jgi:hypothetical protein
MQEFKSNEDIYKFVNEIITQAKAQGDVKTVNLLQNAIDRGGFLPSERLGELRLAFEELDRGTKEEYLILLRRDIKAAIRSINEALKRANRFW